MPRELSKKQLFVARMKLRMVENMNAVVDEATAIYERLEKVAAERDAAREKLAAVEEKLREQTERLLEAERKLAVVLPSRPPPSGARLYDSAERRAVCVVTESGAALDSATGEHTVEYQGVESKLTLKLSELG